MNDQYPGTLTVQQRLRARAEAKIEPPNSLDNIAADLLDTLEAARAGDQHRLFHLEGVLAELERKLDEFTHAVTFGTMPPVVREMVAMIVRTTPSIGEAEAIEIVEKAAAKVFNEDFKTWQRSRAQDR